MDGYRGKAWKELIWNIAQASNIAYFEYDMFKKIQASEDVYAQVNDKPP